MEALEMAVQGVWMGTFKFRDPFCSKVERGGIRGNGVEVRGPDRRWLSQ